MILVSRKFYRNIEEVAINIAWEGAAMVVGKSGECEEIVTKVIFQGNKEGFVGIQQKIRKGILSVCAFPSFDRLLSK